MSAMRTFTVISINLPTTTRNQIEGSTRGQVASRLVAYGGGGAGIKRGSSSLWQSIRSKNQALVLPNKRIKRNVHRRRCY